MPYIFIILLSFFVLSVQANVSNGEAFLTMCGNVKDFDNAVPPDRCIAYVEGVYEAYVSFNQWELIAETLCLPEQVTSLEMTRSVVAFIGNQQGYAENPASAMVLNALADTYPCN